MFPIFDWDLIQNDLLYGYGGSMYLWSDQILVHLLQGSRVSNRLFYLSIPPNIFLDVVKCASKSASSLNGWTRVIVEKPFGRDSESSAALTRGLKQYLVEDQIFRWYKHLRELVTFSGAANLDFNLIQILCKYQSSIPNEKKRGNAETAV
jgi:hypothetical protein